MGDGRYVGGAVEQQPLRNRFTRRLRIQNSANAEHRGCGKRLVSDPPRRYLFLKDDRKDRTRYLNECVSYLY